MVTADSLRARADILAIQLGEDSIFVISLREAAAEIDTLSFTVEALTGMAKRAAEDYVFQRRLAEDFQKSNSDLHKKNVELRSRLEIASVV